MLARFQSPDQTLNLLQSSWAAQLDPIVRNPLSSAVILPNVSLKSGPNTINHTLGHKLNGWFICGINAPVTIYDSQSSNSLANLTLILNSSAAAVVSLVVF